MSGHLKESSGGRVAIAFHDGSEIFFPAIFSFRDFLSKFNPVILVGIISVTIFYYFFFKFIRSVHKSPRLSMAVRPAGHGYQFSQAGDEG